MPGDYYVLQRSGEEIDALLDKAGSATGAVRYDAAQSLTDAQKQQARDNIAAAPSGFGFGERVQEIRATSDSETYGDYCAKIDAKLATMPNGTPAIVMAYPPQIYGRASNTLSILFKGDDKYAFLSNIGAAEDMLYGWRMSKANGVWLPFEWVDPPMQLGVEYRTTERFFEKPVYVKAINFGAVAIGLNQVSFMSDVDRPIRCYAMLTNMNATIPWIGTPGTDQSFCSINGANARIQSTAAFPAGAVVFVGYYYKTNE